jgi:hypothetical protein
VFPVVTSCQSETQNPGTDIADSGTFPVMFPTLHKTDTLVIIVVVPSQWIAA